jgi:uncharacterized membrane protein YeaQ/YmgE (transglycosylase-associated protein family)
MNDVQALLSQPSVGFLAMIVIGILAGWIAERVTESQHGILTNLLVGICGAFVGSKLAEVLQIPVFGFFRTLVAAIVGAVLVLWIWRALHRPPSGAN